MSLIILKFYLYFEMTVQYLMYFNVFRSCHGRDRVVVVSSNLFHGEVYLIQHYVINVVSNF